MTKSVALALVLSSVLLGGCQWTNSTSSTGEAPSAHLTIAAGWSPLVRGWERALHAAARQDPTTVYPTPSPRLFRERLARAGPQYGFRVVSLRFVRAPQGSPLLIIQATSAPARFVRDVPAIMRLLDPHRPSKQDWEGWAYEGIFVGAQSSHGIPFLDVSNVMRVHSGGQWARTPNLYPYPHA
jgi:hypothetical protein